jgi:hypothetical protein
MVRWTDDQGEADFEIQEVTGSLIAARASA